MATTQVFASTADGCLQSQDSTYTDAADGVGGASITNDPGGANELWVGQLLFGDYVCYESFVSFDLSAIPPSHKVNTVTLETWLLTDQSAADFTAGARALDWGASVTSADWQDRAEIDALAPTLAQLASSGIGATGAYKAWTSVSGGLEAAVQAALGGTLRLLLYSGNHRLGSAPAGGEFLEFASADTSGTTNDPRLTVVHTPGQPLFQRSTPRVWRMRGRT